MKPKLRLRRAKKVYYFQHSKGILQRRHGGSAPKLLLAGLFSICALSSFGFGLNKYYENHQTKVLYQQVNAQKPKAQKTSEDESGLKQISTQAQEDKMLNSIISEKLAGMPKSQKWSVYVRDLKSNRMANVGADETFEAASFYKLFLLAPLENKVSATSWSRGVGPYSIKTCVDKMIRLSDNACGEAVGRYVGWNNADKFNEGLGFTKTKLGNSKQPQTTARDTGELMYRLQNSQLLSDKARRILFDALYAQKHRLGIPAGCLNECLIANKTGESDKVHNDAAVVTHGASKYVVVIMSSGASWTDVGAVEQTIAAAMLP